MTHLSPCTLHLYYSIGMSFSLTELVTLHENRYSIYQDVIELQLVIFKYIYIYIFYLELFLMLFLRVIYFHYQEYLGPEMYDLLKLPCDRSSLLWCVIHVGTCVLITCEAQHTEKHMDVYMYVLS